MGILRPSKKKHSKPYTPKPYTYTPPKPLTAEQLKTKIENAPGEIVESQNLAKYNLKMIYVSSGSALVSVIILICVYFLVPYEEEVEVEKVNQITNKKTMKKEKKVTHLFFFTMLVFCVILIISIGCVIIYRDRYQLDNQRVTYKQENILKWQSELNVLASPSA